MALSNSQPTITIPKSSAVYKIMALRSLNVLHVRKQITITKVQNTASKTANRENSK